MAPAPGWPASLRQGRVALRPLRVRDAGTWSQLRTRNEEWLSPWEGRQPGLPPSSWEERHSGGAFGVILRTLRRESRAGRCVPFAVTYDGDLVGQVTVAHIVRGAAQSGNIGYWVDHAHAGRGVVPVAVALALDHCFGPVGLHRVEANVRPENAASLRVVEKVGFREEGLHRDLLFIDGGWRDHRCFAMTASDQPEGVLHRLLALADH